MRKILELFLSLLILTSCTNSKSVNPTLQNLNFIHKTILDNHPGVYNELDPEFKHNLSKAYSDAKTKIIYTSDANKQRAAINEFVQRFNDAHLRVVWKDARLIDSKNVDSAKFIISNLPQNIAWITLPTFALNNTQEKQFQKLLKELPKLSHKSYIVFDLRGNSGGNSDYGSSVIDAIFGKKYAMHQRCLANKDVYVDWRVSAGNATYVDFLARHYNDNSEWRKVSAGLKRSLSEGKNYYQQYFSTFYCDAKNWIINTAITPVSAKIIIIIGSDNFSATLDFIDEIKMMTQNVILVGLQTGTDRLYMDVRSVELPDHAGQFIFPMKVYRNRLRGDDEPYRPDIKLEDIESTAVLKDFVVDRIKNKGVTF